MNTVKLQDITLIYINPLHSNKIILKIQKSIKETIPFIIAMKRIKYLGINLPKERKDLYIENYKTLMKTKMTQIDGEIYNVYGLEESI